MRMRGNMAREALAFLACFSQASTVRTESYQNEELNVAIEQLRLRPHDVTWLIPIRFDDCQIPDRDIGGGRTLRYRHHTPLFGEYHPQNAKRPGHGLRHLLRRPARAPRRPAPPHHPP